MFGPVLAIALASAASATVVERIYPSGNALPANQLKLYIEFSAPMARGDAYRHIRLIDDRGRKVEHAFLELDEELWDAEQRRFTLLFDPGRVKRDLAPNVEDGAPLESGRRYRLVISAAWPDAQLRPLDADVTKEFTVAAPDRLSPDPSNWTLSAPKAHSTDPLTVEFHEALDYRLLQRTLHVLDGAGKKISGSVRIDNHETRWRFTPTQRWRAGEYRLSIDSSLEDLAGNRIGRLFEVDTRASPDEANRPVPPSVSLGFEIAEHRP